MGKLILGHLFLIMAHPTQSKTHRELAYLLMSRGMTSSEGRTAQALSELIESCLTQVNYYRLAAYWYPFRIPNKSGHVPTKKLMPETSWETVWAHYQFDRHLRLMLFEAISRIEIALREKIVNLLAACDRTQLNPQNKPSNFSLEFLQQRHNEKTVQYTSLYSDFLLKAERRYRDSSNDAARHYRVHKTVKKASDLPIWVFMEFVTFGGLNVLISTGLRQAAQRKIAKELGFPNWQFFVSAVSLLHQVRNECAHQGRIWNRQWTQSKGRYKGQPILKKTNTAAWQHWSQPETEMTWLLNGDNCLTRSGKHTAAALVVCYLMLKAVAPENSWKQRLFALFDSCPINKIGWEVGFCHQNWQKHSIWN